MQKFKRLIASFIMALSLLAITPVVAHAEWRSNNTGWWYTEGNSWATGWKSINGNWYYFYSDGYMAHDTIIGGYYLNSDGVWNISYSGSSTASGASNGLYSEPATGDMEGWQKLRGHEYENVAEIYFKLVDGIESVQVKDIRKFDLNKVVEWVDDNGIKRHNTLGEIYQLFGYSNKYTTDWLSSKFGNLYGEWLSASCIDANKIVSDYLEKTGQISKSSNITITPDSKVTTTKVEKKEASSEEIIKKIEEYMEKQSQYEVLE